MRVIIADDAVLIREGVAALLRSRGLEVTATVGDAPALLKEIQRQPPDAAIVDIRMPPTFGSEGLEAAERIRAEHPEVSVLLFSLHIDIGYALNLVNGGEGHVGYLLKERVVDIDQLVSTLDRIVSGGAVIDPAIVEELMARQRAAGPVGRLTPREREVLALMAEGLTNPAIAERMHLSRKTVESYVTNILERLEIPHDVGLHRRVQAVLLFLQAQ
ncbi:response regulator transcription factor [Spirillospora sp. CA-294931]|uniref:response regulator transcription factor n=1 Tax=Spirillospora sp. CA-294931 TaxID=3240042 RepID=UPI003D8EFBBB